MTRDIASVGDHFVIGLRPGTRLHPGDADLFAALRPVGVVLFQANFLEGAPYDEWLDSHTRLLAEIRSATGRERMFIGIDHEGGRVLRTPPPITPFAYAAKWAGQAAAVGTAMGTELASLGINLNFAPVLDIHSNPENRVIARRAFGSDGDAVQRAALPFMAALEAAGVRACGKHFPGHGDTWADSHHELPVLAASRAELAAGPLRPFRTAIEAGLGMVMTSHILLPAVDADFPTPLSRVLVSDILRGECGFGGVVVSDDVGMHALDGFFEREGAAARFLAAGNDLLMITAYWTDNGRARGFATDILAALEAGTLDPALVDRSRRRVHAMLDATPQHAVRKLLPDAFAAHRAAGPVWELRPPASA